MSRLEKVRPANAKLASSSGDGSKRSSTLDGCAAPMAPPGKAAPVADPNVYMRVKSKPRSKPKVVAPPPKAKSSESSPVDPKAVAPKISFTISKQGPPPKSTVQLGGQNVFIPAHLLRRR